VFSRAHESHETQLHGTVRIAKHIEKMNLEEKKKKKDRLDIGGVSCGSPS
jgi:hypothetical protein